MIRSAFVLFVLSVTLGVAQDAAKPDPADASRRLRDQTDKVFAKWDSTVSPGCACRHPEIYVSRSRNRTISPTKASGVEVGRNPFGPGTVPSQNNNFSATCPILGSLALVT